MSGNRGESRPTSQPNRSWGSLRSTFQPRRIAASDDTRDQAEADLFADAIQVALRYILNEHHGGRAESYNLFFYHLAVGPLPRRCRVGWYRPTSWAIVWPRLMPRPRSISMLSACVRIWKRSYSKINTRVMRTV